MSDAQAQFATTESRQRTAPGRLRHGSLFSGIGGMDLGLDWAGFETVWQVEINPFARSVLEKHWQNVPKFIDVRQCGKHNLERVDIISGGFPCQDESVAGKKRGLGTPDNPTERSGLWYEYHRIIQELRPPFVLIENVPRLLHTEDGDRVLSDMGAIGYACWPLIVGADVLGAPHRRKRAWIICHREDAVGGCDFEKVLAAGWAFPPDCQRQMEEARERWDYWRRELAGPDGQYSPFVTTPTATMVLEQEWPRDGRFYSTDSGRMRKKCKTGTDSSMSCLQELAARAVTQTNPNLTPTPEAFEDLMGYPRGHTDLGVEGPEDAAYADIYRGISGPRHCRERLKAIGNSVVPQIPMQIGCFIQQFKSQEAVLEDAGIREFKEVNVSESSPEQSICGQPIGEDFSRVEARFDTLDAERTKKAYQELNAALEGLASTVVHTIEQAAPKLDRMQSLLSQRGAERKKILKKAGLLKWMQWAKGFAKKFDCTVRTIQFHIKWLREGRERGESGRAAADKKPATGSRRRVVRLDSRQQAALVKAQLATNDLVAALKNGGDWQTPLAEYEKVAVSPAKLDSFMDALSPEPELEDALAQLVNALGPCEDALPAPAKDALHKARAALNTTRRNGQMPSGRAMPSVTKRTRVDKQGKPEGTRSAALQHEMQSKDARKTTAGATGKPSALVGAAEEEPRRNASATAHAQPSPVPQASPSPTKVTVCPPALGPDGERREILVPSSEPGRRQGNHVRSATGRWEYEPELEASGTEEAPNGRHSIACGIADFLKAKPDDRYVPTSEIAAHINTLHGFAPDSVRRVLRNEYLQLGLERGDGPNGGYAYRSQRRSAGGQWKPDQADEASVVPVRMRNKELGRTAPASLAAQQNVLKRSIEQQKGA